MYIEKALKNTLPLEAIWIPDCLPSSPYGTINPLMLPVTCSNCGLRILVPSTVQGRVGVCFGCGARLVIPGTLQDIESLSIDFGPDTRISDRYVIRERIGEGGMGVVYRADDTLVNEEVALKFMKTRMLRTQKGQLAFIQEAQIARRLRHENIVAVHDLSWTHEGILYLTMEFVKGPSLRSLLRVRRQNRELVDVRLAVSFINQILSALEYAHRTVIHRDLKPENIIITSGEQLKVLDFGLAKVLDEEPRGESTSTAVPSSRIIGTWAYAAPEQKKHWPLDYRADLYAVGLIFYELLTLRTPLDKQVNVENVRADVSPSLLDVLARALYPEREQRWQNAAEFRSSLLKAFESSYRRTAAVPVNAKGTGHVASTEGMIYLEGGSFLMGSNDVPEEAPEFEAYVKPFYIDAYPVTVEQYAAFLKDTEMPPPKFWDDNRFNGPTQPVVGITWQDANAYAAWAGKQLPTEIEWEYAARGKENRKYPWGSMNPDSNLCNFGDFLGMPSIVSMHREGGTPDGVYDMAGNVYEWTVDLFTPYTHAGSGEKPMAAPLRAVRGGCWFSPAHELRCSHRKGLFPEAQLSTVGFRCVVPTE